jgi:Domain of unknown function (DUF5666)
MRRPFISACLLTVLAAMAMAAPLKPTPPVKPKSHGNALSGTVASLDEAKKTFTVRNAAGKETVLLRTNATRVRGGVLKTGDRVSVRWLERDKKMVATSIRIEPPSLASATPTPTATTPAGLR